MSQTATLSPKFEITIPKTICEARRWQAGQSFAFIPKGAAVLLVPVPTIEELRGCAVGSPKPDVRDRSDRF